MRTLIFLLVTNMVSQAVVWYTTSEHMLHSKTVYKVYKVV